MTLLVASLGSITLGVIMFGLSVFLILLVLVQRGKGGGLTGALGGPGGQSAFGSKAGDTFTLITAVSAIIWGLVCAIAMYTLGVPPLSAEDELEFEDDPPAAMAGDTGENTAGAIGSLDDLDLSMPEEGGNTEMEPADEGAQDPEPESESAGEATIGGEATTETAPDGGEGTDADAADAAEGGEETQGEDSSGTPSVELNPPSNE
ncbi:MAG: preprotein translocase subunit SecG [Planctomycetota bacterium]